MSKIRSELRHLKTFIFDCDGVLWRGNEKLPHVAQFMRLLRQENKNVFFVTNNSTKTRCQYVSKFEKHEIQAAENEVFGTAYLSAYYFSKNNPKGKVYIMGSEAQEKELAAMGFKSIGVGQDHTMYTMDTDVWRNAEFDKDVSDVLVGFDKDFNFSKMLRASSYIKSGANFIASNEDAELPLNRDDLLIPGTGCITASIKFGTKKDPIVVGKPSRLAFDLISELIGAKPEECVMFGDRLDTDIQFGLNCGLKTVLTLTGVTNETKLADSPILPDLVIRDFGDLFEK